MVVELSLAYSGGGCSLYTACNRTPAVRVHIVAVVKCLLVGLRHVRWLLHVRCSTCPRFEHFRTLHEFGRPSVSNHPPVAGILNNQNCSTAGSLSSEQQALLLQSLSLREAYSYYWLPRIWKAAEGRGLKSAHLPPVELRN